MATEIGGQFLALSVANVGDGPNETVNNFFQGFFDQSLNGPRFLEPGHSEHRTDIGKLLHIYDENFKGSSIHLTGNQDAGIGTGQPVTVYGGSGDTQILITDNADHVIRGGSGNDFIQAIGSGRNTLYGEAGRDTLVGGANNDTLIGGNGNDYLIGGAGDDLMRGGAGKDWLIGGAGNDRLLGGGGRDWLQGDAGNDRMTGGGGNDRFVFNTVVTDPVTGQAVNISTGEDVITDFKRGDVLQIADRNGDGVVKMGEGNDFTVTQVGRDTVITFLDEHGNPSGDKVTLKNVDAHDLHDGPNPGTFIIS